MLKAAKKISVFQSHVKNIGYKPSLGSYEKRKLGIFNLMNFVGLLSGIIIPITILLNKEHMPVYAWLIACSPTFISLLVMALIHHHQYELGRMCYFTLYPLMTSVVYAAHIDMGIEFFFVLYGVLSVFFLQKIYSIIFCFTLSMACYFAENTFWNNYTYRLEETHYYFFIFNHLLAPRFEQVALSGAEPQGFPVAPAGQVVCPACGATYPANASFCPRCGRASS